MRFTKELKQKNKRKQTQPDDVEDFDMESDVETDMFASQSSGLSQLENYSYSKKKKYKCRNSNILASPLSDDEHHNLYSD